MGVVEILLPALLQALSQVPSLVAEVEALWSAASAQQPPTADQQAQIDAALEAAHKALQAS